MLPARRSATTLVVAAAVVVAGACGGGGDASDEVVAPAGATSVPATEPTSGTGPSPAHASELLAFSAPAIGGGEVDASIHQGRPVLLWFWSPW